MGHANRPLADPGAFLRSPSRSGNLDREKQLSGALWELRALLPGAHERRAHPLLPPYPRPHCSPYNEPTRHCPHTSRSRWAHIKGLLPQTSVFFSIPRPREAAVGVPKGAKELPK